MELQAEAPLGPQLEAFHFEDGDLILVDGPQLEEDQMRIIAGALKRSGKNFFLMQLAGQKLHVATDKFSRHLVEQNKALKERVGQLDRVLGRFVQRATSCACLNCGDIRKVRAENGMDEAPKILVAR